MSVTETTDPGTDLETLPEVLQELYPVEDGALTAVPCYESHKRGKNWAAIITADPTAPNGLGRRFLARANGRYFYMTAGLAPGSPVEFGADYYSGGGRPSRTRRYYVVIRVTDSSLVLERHATADAALKAAKAFAA